MNITKEQIDSLFSKCFFREDEIVKGRPTSDYVMVESPLIKKNLIVFSANHLNEIKKDIIELIDEIPNIEEGVTIPSLSSFEWGNEDDLNKVLLMGLATKTISTSFIEVIDESICFIKRDKTYDFEEIKGLPKENIPETKDEVQKTYTEEEKEIIRQNGIRITNELNDYLPTINRGLNFLGIKAKLDEKTKNKLNFYDQEGNLLYERVFLDTDGIIGIEGMLNQRLKCEFFDNEENKITYLYDNRHIFRLDSKKDKKYSRGLELTGEEGNYQGIKVWSINPEDEYTIKSLEVDLDGLDLDLENAFGPYGNYVDGTTRKLNYHSPLNPRPYLSMIEKVWPRHGTYLYCDEAGFKVFNEEPIVPYQNRDMFNMLATNIVAHPRNREAINYILTEFERVLPGVKEFFVNNSFLLKYLLTVPYINDEITETIIKKTINEACNFKMKELIQK